MSCPHCNHPHLKVILTQRTELEEIIRRKHCLVCGHRFYTMQPPEQPISQYDLQWPPRLNRHLHRVKYKPTAQG